MTTVSRPIVVASIVLLGSASLVAGTAAVVRAQPGGVPTAKAQTVQVPAVADQAAIVKAYLDSIRPVQLPVWTTRPTGPCTLGEMAMVLVPTSGGTANSKLFVCQGSSAACLTSGTATDVRCFPTDATCSAYGGAPVGGSSANGVTCPSSIRACTFTHPVCAHWTTPYTHWEMATTTP